MRGSTTRGVLGVAVLAVAIAASACVESESIVCSNGRICPAGTSCDVDNDRCLSADQVAACPEGTSEGDPCSATGVPMGFCRAGACEAPSCGDGYVDEREECDTDDNLNGQSCDTLDFYDGGVLKCTNQCTFDTSGCLGYCGDGVKNGEEACDDADLDNETCLSLGFYGGGTLGCTSICTYNTDECIGRCGDGVGSGPEVCDGDDLRGLDCTDFGFYEPDGLACTAGCLADTAACAKTCGDLEVNGPEMCDGGVEDGKNCLDFGFDMGLLGCTANTCTLDFNGCGWIGWERKLTGFGGVLADVWGTDSDHVYAVGEVETVLFYDGSDWTDISMDVGAVTNLESVWGSAADDVYIAGGLVYHFDGSNWGQVDVGLTGSAHKVWGSGPNDVYVMSSSELAHFDGGSWAQVPVVPSLGFVDVHGSGPDDVWLVDKSGVAFHRGVSVWTQEMVPSGLLDIWVAPTGELFMSHESGDVYQYVDGTFYLLFTAAGTVNGIDGRSRTDVTMVSGNVIAHHDGIETQPFVVNQSVSVHAVWVGDDGSAVAVGGGGVAAHYGGRGWTAEDTPQITSSISALWGTGPRRMYAAGYETLWERAGASWVEMEASPGPLTAMWGTREDDIYVVGQGGLIRHFDGSSWQTQTSGTVQYLSAVWGTGPNDVFVVGLNGVILHNNGGGWVSMTSNTSIFIRDVWGASSNDVWAVGLGAILHYDGSNWSEAMTFSPGHLTSIWGRAADDIYAVGVAGWLWHYDGTSWSTIQTATLDTFNDVTGDGAGGIIISSLSGTLWRYDGSQVVPMRTTAQLGVYSLWSTPGVIYVGADDGEIPRLLESTCAPSETTCTDLYDEDCDGFMDCADPDCAASCTQDLCAGAATITCGAGINSNTNGGTDQIFNYACLPRAATGPERVFVFDSTRDQLVTATVQPSGSNVMDVAVIEDVGGLCDPTNHCLAGAQPGGGTAGAVFPALDGGRYYIVVDGPESGAGAFNIDLSCN